jgi:hypothetical protein
MRIDYSKPILSDARHGIYAMGERNWIRQLEIRESVRKRLCPDAKRGSVICNVIMRAKYEISRFRTLGRQKGLT